MNLLLFSCSRCRLAFVFTLLLVNLAVAPTATGQATVDYNEHIKPLLSDRCYHCHGPDAETREADLRLDHRDDALRASQTGNVDQIIQPGDALRSELYLRITADDPDVRMPPADAKLSLSEIEIEKIRQWIDQGAAWDEHWSFRLNRPATPPDVASPWPRSPIDQFILHRLQQADLQPAAPAEPRDLIRRLYLALVGLPPRPEQVRQFVNAPDLDHAYEQAVDQLLQSPKFGERMAADWLDVARYSDTYGYQVDRDRYVWPWRDWVIDAFNRNVPYDQFVTEQLAGDLLPSPTQSQILATTFCRLHPQKVEGGSTPEEFRVEYVADRTQTFATAFLGLTLECARCHDHKYDPLTQREYYQLSAFFDKIDEAGLYSYFTNSVPTPTLTLEDHATRQQLQQARKLVQVELESLRQLRASRHDAFRLWISGRERAGTRSENSSDENSSAASASLIPNRIALADFEADPPGDNTLVEGKFGKAIKLTGDDRVELQVGNFTRNQPFTIALWLQTPASYDRAVVYHRSRAWTDAASRGYELLLEDGRLSAALIHFWPGNAVRVKATQPLPIGQWTHVAVTYDGSSRASGLTLYTNGQQVPVEVVRDKLTKNITGGGFDQLMVGERFRDRGFKNGLVDHLEVYDRELMPVEIRQLYDNVALRDWLAADIVALDDHQQRQLYDYYLATIDLEYRNQLERLKAARTKRSELEDSLAEIMVMDERDGQRQTYLLVRGAYDQRGEAVEPGTPAIFAPFPDDQPRNRLGLARWLTDPRNPLTARVAVNRYWQLLLGQGLVRTPEDFGSQGKPPTHARLLDWLAHDFVSHGWDVKRTIKQIVMSATFRQSTQASEVARQIDPENELLSHVSRFRLPAETLRDTALFVGNLLVDSVGGPPAKPYELEASFKPSPPDPGAGVYRRSVYTYWKRTGPAPVMMTLDAAKRDVCRVRRERTSSPLQALVLLNGPQFVEASRGLAQRVIQHVGTDRDVVLTAIFEWLTSHPPDDEQLEIVTRLYERQRAYFSSNPDACAAYLAVGRLPVSAELDRTRLAAYTAVANSLMNYDRSLTNP